MGKFFVGTSGFYYKSWIGNFYPKKTRQKELFDLYLRRFNTVEINSSFYRIPNSKTVEDWVKKVRKDFVFCFKMSRFVTHYGKLDTKVKSFNAFFKNLEPVSRRSNKNLILVQTHSTFKKDVDRLKKFSTALPKSYFYAFEFRHESWFDDEIYYLLKEDNSGVVLSDSPVKKGQRHWPMHEIETADFFYIRFHGSKRLFSSNYSQKELGDYAKLIKRKLKKGMNVYAYFNNDALGFAPRNALRLSRLVERN